MNRWINVPNLVSIWSKMRDLQSIKVKGIKMNITIEFVGRMWRKNQKKLIASMITWIGSAGIHASDHIMKQST